MLCRDGKFSPGNAFIGFQTDTPAAIVFQMTNFLRKMREQGVGDDKMWETVHNAGVFENTTSEELAHLQEDSELWKHAVSCLHGSEKIDCISIADNVSGPEVEPVSTASNCFT